MATIPIVLNTGLLSKQNPIFDFVIPSYDFFINQPSLSVSEANKSVSLLQDGELRLLNKNTSPVYFKSITLIDAKINDQYLSSIDKVLRFSLVNEVQDVTNNVIFINYKITYKGSQIGTITCRYNLDYYNTTKILYPMQSLPLSFYYKVDNVGILNQQYFGKSNSNKNKRVGLIDFTFTIECYDNNSFTTTITEPLIVSAYLVNSAYVPPILNEPIDYGS